jgi:glycosyltransferase involved in cell wall biosynthesis
MRVLVVTNMYPTPEMPAYGIFVREQVEALKKEGVQIDVFFVNGKKSKFNYLWAIFRLWFWLFHHRYDLIHAHYVFSGIIARFQFSCPVVLTHHGLEVFCTWQRFPSRIITRLVDKVILVSQEQKVKLAYEKAEIIPCGVDLNLFQPMPREEAKRKLNIPLSDNKLVLVTWAGDVSRPEKRFDIVQKAVALAQEKDPKIQLLPVTGKPYSMIPLYMNACDVLLLVSNAEGSPMVIKEAMACNLPIVSVPVGDVAEVIGGTDGCYLCRQDPADVAEKLVFALSNIKRTQGREKIRQFEQDGTARRIVALYRDVLENKNGQHGYNPFYEKEKRDDETCLHGQE